MTVRRAPASLEQALARPGELDLKSVEQSLARSSGLDVCSIAVLLVGLDLADTARDSDQARIDADRARVCALRRQLVEALRDATVQTAPGDRRGEGHPRTRLKIRGKTWLASPGSEAHSAY